MDNTEQLIGSPGELTFGWKAAIVLAPALVAIGAKGISYALRAGYIKYGVGSGLMIASKVIVSFPLCIALLTTGVISPFVAFPERRLVPAVLAVSESLFLYFFLF